MHAPSWVLSFVLLAFGASAAPLSGQYGGLLVLVRGNEVAGAFSEQRQGNGTAEAPQFSCGFLFRGSLAGDTATIRVWTPPDAATGGVLRFPGFGVAVRLEAEQPGCMMTGGPTAREDYETSFVAEGRDWIGVRLVAGRRVVLRARPWADGRREPHVSSYDAVAILGIRAGWMRVRSFGGERPSTGWVRAGELFPDRPAFRR